VEIILYNTLGEKVSTILSKKINAGFHSIDFFADNLSSGVYFYQITANE
jgi:predicted cation transporter